VLFWGVVCVLGAFFIVVDELLEVLEFAFALFSYTPNETC
jgi:hypothetical protein